VSTRKRTLIAAAVGFVVLVTGYTAGHAQGVSDTGKARRDIQVDEPLVCVAPGPTGEFEEDSILVDCRDGVKLDYRHGGWWPTSKEWKDR